MPENNDAGTITEPTGTEGTTAGSTGNQPDYKELYQQALADAADWKNRFNGMQGTYQREQKKWKDDTAILGDMKTTIENLTSEKSDLMSQLTGLKEQVDTISSEKEIEKANLERMKIVVEEFPQLTSFLSKGLIPDDSGDELRSKLKTLAETVDGIRDGALTDFKSGSSPKTPPPSKPQGTRDALTQQLHTAFAENNRAEYDRIYNEILKLDGGPNG